MDPAVGANIIAGFSLFVAGFTFYYFLKDHRREKFLLVNEYLKQLLEWHGETVEILIRLRDSVNHPDSPGKNELLTRLSAQIEKGRFFFPNIDKGDGFGKEKPAAYQGYRNLALEFLVITYDLFGKKKASDYVSHAETLQREFTSIVFQVVRPKENLQEIKRLTDKFYASESILEDYLEKDPNSIHFFYDKDQH
jgi:hypothetical protein